MGFPLLTYQDRSDNKLYRLQTPQSPLVRPYMYDYYDMDNYPIGTNAIVAVISYTGYDMEDAMVSFTRYCPSVFIICVPDLVLGMIVPLNALFLIWVESGQALQDSHWIFKYTCIFISEYILWVRVKWT